MTPTHAYLPGLTQRHPEGCFEDIRQTAIKGMTVAELAASSAFAHGKLWIETGYYWEAHEVLEPVWMALPDPSPDRFLIQSMIQTANALLKARMGRPKAARRIVILAQEALGLADAAGAWGVDSGWIESRLAEAL